MQWLASQHLPAPDRTLLLGICGAQGSGKTTLSAAIVKQLSANGIRAATLSLDDLYLTQAARQKLARETHPLFATRGVPGTHDLALGAKLFDDFAAGRALRLPRFDKSTDDRAPESEWGTIAPGLQILVFEGWCVGARAEDEAPLATPVNSLEAEEDTDGVWRRHVNQALAGPYRQLFDRIDHLVMLAAPDFAVVQQWRAQQEEDLRQRERASGSAIMNEAALARFIQHYERLTRHILTEMPDRADLVLRLSHQRAVIDTRQNHWHSGCTPALRAITQAG